MLSGRLASRFLRCRGVVRQKGHWPLIHIPFSFKLAVHNALLGYRNSPCLTHYTRVQGHKFDISFARDSIFNANAFFCIHLTASCNIVFMF